MPHIIRLNRVWELRQLAEAPTDPSSLGETIASSQPITRVDLPWDCDTDEYDENSILLLTRRFNRPSNLDADQPVHLALRPVGLAGHVVVNGSSLTPSVVETDEGEMLIFSLVGPLPDNNRIDLVAPPWECLTQASVRLVIDDDFEQETSR